MDTAAPLCGRSCKTLDGSNTMYEAFEALLRRKNQRFVCTDTGWPEPGPDRHVALLRHEVDPALDDQSLAELRKQLGDLPELIEFYRRYGSARLYCDTIGHASAFFIASPESWPELREGFEGWLEGLDEEEKEELLPNWIADYVVVGEVPNSGNYFLLPLEGPDRGKVFEFEHDGFEFIESAANFAAFVESISTVDAALLNEILGHTRYSDGKSSVQWLCKEYQYDEPAA